MDKWEEMSTWRERAEFQEKRSLYACLLFVLKESNRQTLMTWWSKEVPLRLIIFFALLRECVECFEVTIALDLLTIFKYQNKPIKMTTSKDVWDRICKSLTAFRIWPKIWSCFRFPSETNPRERYDNNAYLTECHADRNWLRGSTNNRSQYGCARRCWRVHWPLREGAWGGTTAQSYHWKAFQSPDSFATKHTKPTFFALPVCNPQVTKLL